MRKQDERYKVFTLGGHWRHGLTYEQAVALARQIWEMTGIFVAIERDN